ncbi:MAG TPA: fused MFS/spermidine synthase, partial [Alphaproteobacteria bacterium]|nr:fused MFS/spermidine synthase [Alphaproteobacteria bacterium]
MGLHAQAQTLFGIYLALMTFALCCILVSARKGNREERVAVVVAPVTETGTAPGAKKWLAWLFLSFVPSSLLMAVTVYITTDIISAPMIWVLPLALYLMTFVIAFSRKPIISLNMIEFLHPPAVIMAIVMIYAFNDTHTISWAGMAAFLVLFTIAALSCHMRLVSLRPLEENSKGLTAFYLMMSVGGALGGILNAFIIPIVTDRLVELPLMLAISVLLHPAIRKSGTAFYIILASVAATLLLINIDPPILPWNKQQIVILVFAACLAFCAFVTIRKPKSAFSPFTVFICGAAVIVPLTQFGVPKKDQLFMTRNFYGTIRVYERDLQVNGKTETMRYMRHGTTTHGAQFLSPELQNLTPAYYPHTGPVGDIFRLFPSEHTAVVGLGAGTVNCFNTGTTPFLFIEIDPAVVDVAREYFKYLSDCNKAAPAETVVGDGRIELLKLPKNSQDIIVLDAFSSDVIPTHLLTVDALKEYKELLKDKGLIVLNISNRYFNLLHIMSKNAHEAGLHPYGRAFDPEDRTYIYPNFWMAMGKDDAALKILEEHDWRRIEEKTGLRAWTDDYTNLMGMLEFKL